ncbi:hypothetical protein F5Y02DRAFT_423113 [Annulohypoxylon stygium]|nr:hypothetical protein F5Y02DRAFT_423113 [Annulohypoxylon stygium]
MPSLFQKIQAKIELFRLEQRYTRNRHRRSAFISNAIYVDGEYIYQTPNNTGSSTNSASTSASSPMEEPNRRHKEAIESILVNAWIWLYNEEQQLPRLEDEHCRHRRNALSTPTSWQWPMKEELHETNKQY